MKGDALTEKAGQAMILLLMLGAILAAGLAAYSSFLQRQRQQGRVERTRFRARDASGSAVELTNQLLKSAVIKGYMAPAAAPVNPYYMPIPSAVNPANNLFWQMTAGWLRSSGKSPVATVNVTVCSPTDLQGSLILSSYKAKGVMPPCPTTVKARVIFNGGTATLAAPGYVELALDVAFPGASNEINRSDLWANKAPPLSPLQAIVEARR